MGLTSQSKSPKFALLLININLKSRIIMMKLRFFLAVVLTLAITTSGFSQIMITFTVDVTGMYIGAGGVHIAGEFATDSSLTILEDWQPGSSGSQMTLLSGTTYTVDVSFPSSSAGKPLQFEFVRDEVWMNSNGDMSEGNPYDCCLDYSCGVDDGAGGFNRIITIPECTGSYDCTFNQCASLVVSSLPSFTVTPQDTIICLGQSIQLHAVSSGVVTWFPDPTLSCTSCNDPFASPVVPTHYFVTSALGSCLVKDTVFVNPQSPSINSSPDTFLCRGDSVQLFAMGSGIISWFPNTALSCALCDDPIASPLSSIWYYVTSTVGSCSVKDSMFLTVDAISINAGSDQNILLGESVQLEASGAADYTWQPASGLSCTDCSSPIASPSVTTTYQVASTSDLGCKASDSVTIIVTVPCAGIFFPNAFTPNSDGRNDTFGAISELNPPIKSFRIFNRWGQLIYESTALDKPWDGNFHNKPQSLGTYVYVLELDCEGGSTMMSGEVMLIR